MQQSMTDLYKKYMEDIIFDSDIVIENGDFKIGESIYQEVDVLLQIPQGGLRENGYFGIDLANQLDEDGSVNFEAELKKQLKLDKKRLKTYHINGANLNIDVEPL